MTPNRWDFLLDKDTYGVDVAGFLKGYIWENSPVILYAELIETNYYFDLYLRIEKARKTSQFKKIRYAERNLDLPTDIPYNVTFWELPDIVYEYVTYFSVDTSRIVMIVLSSKEKKYIRDFYNDYKRILRNFARVAVSFQE